MHFIPELLHKGLDLASDFLSYLREGNARDDDARFAAGAASNEVTASVVAAIKSSTETNTRLVAAIDEVARKLDAAVHEIVGKISDKLEHEQLEKLTSQIKAVHFALEFEDRAMLTLALGRIMEQIEYSKNRINEGKQEWLGPWLMAESIRIVGLREIASTGKALEVVNRETQAFRVNILDFGGSYLIKRRNIPWVKIAEFVEGRNEDILAAISVASREQKSAITSKMNDAFESLNKITKRQSQAASN